MLSDDADYITGQNLRIDGGLTRHMYLRRQETNEAVRELSKKGTSIRQIVR